MKIKITLFFTALIFFSSGYVIQEAKYSKTIEEMNKEYKDSLHKYKQKLETSENKISGSRIKDNLVVDCQITKEESIPFSIISDGVVLAHTDPDTPPEHQPNIGQTQNHFRSVPPRVCIESKNYPLSYSSELPWGATLFVEELLKPNQTAEHFKLVYLGECPESYQGESIIKNQDKAHIADRSLLNMKSEITENYKNCKVNPYAENEQSIKIFDIEGQSILEVCNIMNYCQDQPKYSSVERWVFSEDRTPHLFHQRVEYPSRAVYHGDDAYCETIYSAADLNNNGAIEFILHHHGAESWGVSLHEYIDGKFIKHLSAFNGI